MLAPGPAHAGPFHPTAAASGRGPVAAAVAYLDRAPLTNPMYVAWAMLGIESTGAAPPSAMRDDLVAHSPGDVGSIEREILAISPIGSATGTLTARLERQIRRDGSVGEEMTLTTFAVMALRAVRRPIAPRTVRWLAAQQDGDGGYPYSTAGAGSDVDDTGSALEGLAAAGAAGVRPPGVAARERRAVAFLRHAENRDGGFPAQPGGPSNAQSTAWAIQGLAAVGVHVPAAQRYLRARVTTSGAIDYARHLSITPVWVTGQALMGLTARPLPLSATP